MKSLSDKIRALTLNQILTISLVTVFYVMCIINIISPKKTFSENENRNLAAFPANSAESITSGAFTKEFDTYASDQFFSRDIFVSLKAHSDKLLNKSECNGVLFADDGYLIEKMPTPDTKITDKNISAIYDIQKSGEYDITLCIVPPAFEILKHKLPAFAYNTAFKELNDRISSTFEGTSIKVEDVYKPLMSRNHQYIYYRTDHHQTALGSYIVYDAISDSLGYTAYEESAFNVETLSDSFYGTTWSKAMLKFTHGDVVNKYTLRNADIKYRTEFPTDKSKAPIDGLYDMDKLNTKDKYSVYLGGVHPVVKVSSNAGSKDKLAIIKDSYAHSIVPFLANHYSEIHLIDLRYYNGSVKKYLDENQIEKLLILYNSSTFMTDSSISRINTGYTATAKEIPFGLVEESEPVGDSYFDDAVFIGDSLTDGLKLYSTLKTPTYLSGTGLLFNGVYDMPVLYGQTTFGYLRQNPAPKIYIMLGINYELSPDNADEFIQQYQALINDIKAIHPDSFIYIQSLLPVTERKSQHSLFVTNENILYYNERIMKLAKECECYYLDVHSAMTNESGAMDESSSTDGIHPDTDLYNEWVKYLKCHTVPDGKDSFDYEQKEMSDKQKELLQIAENIESNVAFAEDLSLIDTETAYSLYNLDASKVKDMVLLCGSGACADEIAIFSLSSSSDYTYAQAAIKTHLEDRVNDFVSYIPKEVPKIKNAVIYHNDTTVIVCVTDDYKNAKNIMAQLLNK